MQRREPFDLVTEELDTHGMELIDRDDLDGVTAHSEGAAGEGEVVAGVLDVDEVTKQALSIDRVADTQPYHAVDVLLRGAETVDGRDGRHHDGVAPSQKAVGGGVPEALDLVVDRRVLLDVGVGLRDVGLRLVVVVVRHEVLDRVVRQKLSELIGQLGGEGLVRRHDEGRSLQPLHEPRCGGRLARASRAEEHDVGLTRPDPLLELVDRVWLVTARNEVGYDLERSHGSRDV